MKRVLITGIPEGNGMDRDYRIGDVTTSDLQELRCLAQSTTEARLEKLETFPVLRKVYLYVQDDETNEWYEDRDSYTKTFTRVEPIDVANQCCYQIIWGLP